METQMAAEAQIAMNRAMLEARTYRHEFVTPEHLLIGLLADDDIRALVEVLEADATELVLATQEYLSTIEKLADEHFDGVELSVGFTRVLQRAFARAESSGRGEFRATDLLTAVFDEPESNAVAILDAHGVTRLGVLSHLSHGSRVSGIGWWLESGNRARVTSALLGATAVGAGAFGAHALQDVLTPERLDTWNTAARYQLVHAVALLALMGAVHNRSSQVATLWTLGTLIFSGSLYLLCLTGVGVLGAITPIGGLLLIAGWVMLALPPRG